MTTSEFSDYAKGYSTSGISVSKKKSVEDFQAEYCENINKKLMKANGSVSKADLTKLEAKVLSDVDSLMTKKLDSDVNLYRAMKMEGKIAKGDVIKSPGYSSTSLSQDRAKFITDVHGANYVLQIKAKKGTKGYFPSADTGLWAREQEFTLPRNSNFKVVGVGKSDKFGDGVTVLEVEL